MRPLRPFATLVLATTLLLAAGPPAHSQDEPKLDDEKLVEKRLAEVVAIVNGTAKASDASFVPSFSAKVPATQMDAICADYRKRGGKVTATHLTAADKGAPLAREYELEMERGTVKGSIGLERKEPHRIQSFFIRAIEPRVATFDALKKELSKLPGKVSFSAARLGGDAPVPLADLAPDESLAIGSSFKLYILGALLEEVAAGKRKLEDTTLLKAELRSMPSGMLQTWPVGAPVTLHTLASLMISISDNTATDTLLHEVGRERVEKELVTFGNSKPERTTPFLGTADMFRLKWGGKPELSEKWVKADLAGKRALLGELASVPLPKAGEVAGSEPKLIDQIEWFASASDLVRALDGIRKLTESGPAAAGRGILSINPGADVKKGWKYVGFKGGSEPGVLELAWLLQRDDGVWFSVALGVNDAEDAVDETKIVGLATKAIELTRDAP